MVTSRAIAKK